MELTKYKLGKLIEQCDNRNTDEEYTADDVRGISTGKEFIETKANMDGVSLTSYIHIELSRSSMYILRRCITGFSFEQGIRMRKIIEKISLQR